MDRRKLSLLVLMAVVAILVGACRLVDETRPRAPLLVFGRNAAPSVAWLSLWPMTDPLDAVGFGPDIGVSCMDAPIGSQVVMLDGSPGPQSRVVRVVTQVHPPRAEGAQSVWIDVAADGTALTGEGTPVWWADEPPSC